MTEELVTTQKITLSSAVTQLQQIMMMIENLSSERDESISEEDAMSQAIDQLMPEINQAMDNIQERVDARINFLEYAGIIEDKLKKDVDYLNQKIKVIQNAQKRLKERTKEIMEAMPEIEFKGSMKKFAIQKNGGRVPIHYKVMIQAVMNIIDPTDVGKFPEGYVKKITLFQLQKEVFESHLRAKEIESEAAELLPVGTHVRIR